MLTTPDLTNRFQSQQEIHQLLLGCQQTCWKKKRPQIVSISLEIPTVDPLAVLERLYTSDQLHFYFERQAQFVDRGVDLGVDLDADLTPNLNRNASPNLSSNLGAINSRSPVNEGVEIAAIGAVDQSTLAEMIGQSPEDWGHDAAFTGTTRFDHAKIFIDDCLAHTTSVGSLDLPFSGPHFFCSFTFFDQPTHGGVHPAASSIESDASALPQSPFPTATVFLPRWQIVRHKRRSIVVVNSAISADTNVRSLAAEIWETLQLIHHLQGYELTVPPAHHPSLEKRNVVDMPRFTAAVTSALQAIHAHHLHKVVLAHAVDVISKTQFHLIACLQHLRSLHPDCAIFSISNGQGQNFIGATPERLISIANHQLQTDALAGSAPRGQTATEDATLANTLLGNAKELHEHQVVVDFISQRLTHLGLTPQRSPMPGLLQLTHIQHLQTPIQATLPMRVHPLDVVAVLHPTPAVAGDPQQMACQLIRQYEPFERSLYAAPLGWVDYQGNCEFVVGIRSALLDGNRARLYAGAGIVAGSAPDREWAEIQLKLRALLSALV